VFSLNLESENIFLLNLHLCRVLDPHDTFVVGVQASQALCILGYGRVATEGTLMKGFPTIQEVEKADKELLARWYRFLPSGETPADQKIMRRIAERFEKLGGMTAQLSKKIGM